MEREVRQGGGCLVVPVKIVAVLVVLPVRVVWELLAGAARALDRYLLGPLYTYVLGPVLRGLGRVVSFLLKLVFVWPWTALWRYLLGPLVRALYAYLIAPLASALYRYLLRPLGLAAWWAADLLWRYVLVPASRWAYRYVLRPVATVLAWAWGVAGRVLRRAGWVLIGWPLSQVYRYVLTPVGHVVRAVWRTARDAVREAGAEVRRMLFGTPAGEQARSRARTLSSTTAAADAATAAEFSPPR
ncbi:hypothetical protein AB0N28_14300 [Streptomyces sp. NPDC051130]|uniref:hypothetical protein n=1 Tax=Streptomyces sp. NPDC051130 TaxID=3157223 RepID=UPI00341625F5